MWYLTITKTLVSCDHIQTSTKAISVNMARLREKNSLKSLLSICINFKKSSTHKLGCPLIAIVSEENPVRAGYACFFHKINNLVIQRFSGNKWLNKIDKVFEVQYTAGMIVENTLIALFFN